MDRFNLLLTRLLEEKSKHADIALRTPKRGRSFDYGQASGIYLGYCQVEKLMNDILKEDDNGRR